MELTFLSGGTGTPKLLQGFRAEVPHLKFSVICNTGDDYYWHGLHVSPDLDTILYLLSNRLDENKFWGVIDESFNALDTIKSLGIDEWFNVGDKDLGLHVWRTNLLNRYSLTAITQMICDNWGINEKIFPMSNNFVQTQIISKTGRHYKFQEYFVKYKTNIEIERVEYVGDKSKNTREVENAMNNATNILIGPSNPITSIGPILSVLDNLRLLKNHKQKVLAVSPLVGNNAFSGPTAKLMQSMGYKSNPLGLARYYQGLISKLILDPSDQYLSKKIEDFEIEPIFLNIDMKSLGQKKHLANQIMELL